MDPMFDFMQITKALSDENRVRILMALVDRELCVCQITGMLDLSPSTTSRHLSILRQARLIESERKGKWVYYTAAPKGTAVPFVREAIELTKNSLADSQTVQADEVHIEEVILLSDGDENCHSIAIHSLEEA